MLKPEKAGTLNWVELLSLIGTIVVVPTISTIVSFGLYLNSTLHRMDVRLIRIETRLGTEEDETSLSAVKGLQDAHPTDFHQTARNHSGRRAAQGKPAS